MPRISLEALVCADTKASSLQVNLPSYHFQMNQKQSNIHEAEEQDLKGSQMWTLNLWCLFSDMLRAHAVLLQCQVTVPKREMSGWSLISSRGVFWPILDLSNKLFLHLKVIFPLWFSLCFFHILHFIFISLRYSDFEFGLKYVFFICPKETFKLVRQERSGLNECL